MKKSLILYIGLISYLLYAISCSFSTAQDQHRRVDAVQPAEERCINESAKERTNSSSREWRAATYRGLTVGQSTREDMLRVFGKPKRSDRAAGQTKIDPKPIIWNEYEEGGEFPGKFTIEVDKSSGIIVGMFLAAEKLSKEEAIKRFGDDYAVTRYDWCEEGFEYEDASPIYESPDGALLFIEYRSRGISISVDEENKATYIYYGSKPHGLASKDDCKKDLEEHKKASKQRAH